MTEKEKLINFYNLDKPTINQIIKVIKILIKQELKITDDGYEINSLTGAKVKKIDITPTQIDPVTDENIAINIAKTEAEKVKASILTTISSSINTAVTAEVIKQLAVKPILTEPIK